MSVETSLTDDELETILIIARNRQSGRVTAYEIRELVSGYRKWRDGQRTAEPDSEAESDVSSLQKDFITRRFMERK